MIKITQQTNNLQKMLERIRTLTQQKVESGYFQEQGKHPEADMSYADLAYKNARGDGNIRARDVRPSTMLTMSDSTSLHYFRKQINDYVVNGKNLGESLNNIGWKISDIAVSKFGHVGKDMPANSDKWADLKGDNTPLVFEGYLRDAWAYKDTYNHLIMTYKGHSEL